MSADHLSLLENFAIDSKGRGDWRGLTHTVDRLSESWGRLQLGFCSRTTPGELANKNNTSTGRFRGARSHLSKIGTVSG